ncbi:unnamed protein product [Bursaphelenchus okinawaensis]|uniref:Cadherin domain-containing protein n=1 Tax=Bursaphelenchus okinawaensis TaxID=465554 RepID=A0A811KHP8_9BILA|nr:unnamed protein product [Bursaphelenchus okinawaensis]CAG9104787.1 unnamed protein product [Bursaphelenchus okinawaensis]
MKCKALLCIAWAHLVYKVVSQSDLHFNISESAPVGSVIGYVWDQKYDHENKFYTIFPNEQSQADKLIAVDEKTGEVITIRPLDHEQETELVVLCIPNDGSPSRKVIVTVLDENDNAPTFAVGSVALEVPEYAQIGAEFALPYADDIDSPPNDIQKYRIIAGNVNNAFRLKEKKIDDKIYIDLVVNGPLDREYRERYSLLLEAVDGGSPPRTSNMSVHVHILDANDNAPVFDQVKYNVKIPGNVSLGYHVITVKAQDADEGENARISYQLQNAAFKGTIYFRIDSETGIVTTTSSPLPSDHVFTMVVTAFDHGIPQSLEAIAYLTISVIEANPLHNVLHIDWLTEDNRPYLMENLTIGFVVARVSVSDVPDQSQLSLSSTAALCLKQTDLSQVYLMLICGELDREKESEYKILFTMTSYDGKVIFEHPVHVEVGDVNDNAPEWPEAPYRFVFNRSDDAGQQASRRLIAVDKDYGKNALLHYVLEGTELFRIHPENGVLFSNSPINCSVGNHIRFRVVASDAGHPQHSTSADVLVDIVDNDAEPPLFEKALYEVTVPEDVDVGSCIVQVSGGPSGITKTKH